MASQAHAPRPNANNSAASLSKTGAPLPRTAYCRDARATPYSPAKRDTIESSQFQVSRRPHDRLCRHPARLEPHRTEGLPLRSVSIGTRSIGPFAISGAVMLFPITYIFGDVFTEVYGFAASRRAIWLGFFGTALLYLIGAIVIALPVRTRLAEPAGLLHRLRLHPAHPRRQPHRLLGGRIRQLLHHGAAQAAHQRPQALDPHHRFHRRRPGRRHGSRHHPDLRRNLSQPAPWSTSSSPATP